MVGVNMRPRVLPWAKDTETLSGFRHSYTQYNYVTLYTVIFLKTHLSIR